MSFENFLRWVISDERVEAEWLDLLSLLEYVGCRKILKALSYREVSCDVLQHIQEEASHAHLLKELAVRKGVGNRPWTENHFADLGWAYFQQLDGQITESARETTETSERFYPAVSWAIETRALLVYKQYVKITADEQVKKILAQILAQEKRHETQFGASGFSPQFQTKVKEIEAQLWEHFQSGLFERKDRLDKRREN